MNTLLTSAILIVMSIGTGLSQNCKLKKDKTDEFTGLLTRCTDDIVVGKLPGLIKLRAMVLREGDNYFLGLSINDKVGCLSSESKAMFKTTDDVITIQYQGKIDCADQAWFFSNITESIPALTSSKLYRVRYQPEYARDIDIIDPDFLKKLLLCVNPSLF